MPTPRENCDYMTVRLPSGQKARLEAAAQSESRALSNWAWLILKRELDRRDQEQPVGMQPREV